MKRLYTSLKMLFVIVLLVAGNASLSSAQIGSFEYFFDADPGFGNGIAVSSGFTVANSVAFNMNVPVNGLSSGFHQLCFRPRLTSGLWGHYQVRTFFVTSFTAGNGDITSAEYFFDADPGIGNATTLNIGSGSAVTTTVSLPVNGLSAGFHKLCIRAKNNNSIWGHYQVRSFYVTNITTGNGDITGVEYFFDTDPGVGHGTTIAVTAGPAVTQSVVIPVNSLSAGFHRLYVRAHNTNNTWSHYQTRSFLISTFAGGSAKISGAEYFIDADPGNGNGTAISINPAVDSVNQTFSLNIPNTVAEGDHQIVIRVKNELGQWSHYQTSKFYVPKPKPGSGNALSFDGSNDYLKIPTAGFTGIQTYTIEFWLKSRAANNGTHVFESYAGSAPSLEGNASTGLNYWVGNTSSISTGPLTSDQWYHVACIYDQANGVQQLYVNGVLKGSNNVSVSDALGTDISFMARALYASNQRNFNGVLDEVRIWNKALTKNELRDRMCHKIASTDPLWTNLKAYYNFDEAAGNNAYSATEGSGLLVNGVAREVSGAAIGNVSAHNYAGATAAISLANPQRGDALTATLTGGNADGLQVYCVTDTPNNIAGTTCLGSNNGYFGVFAINGTSPTYDASYNYTGISMNGFSEAGIKLYQRDDNSIATWTDANATLDTAANTIAKSGAQRAEYIISNAVVAPTIAITRSISTPVCAGTVITFSASITNGGTAPVYQWKKNGINVGTDSSGYTDGALQNGDNISCELTSNSACVTTATVASNAFVINVTTSLVASVSASVLPGSTICAGTQVTFTATPVNGGTAPVYQWKINGIAIGGNAATFTSSSLQQGDVVTVDMNTNASCAGPATVSSSGIAMTVNPVVTPTITVVSDTTAICQGNTVSFTASIANGGTTPIYQWKKNGNNVGSNSNFYADNSLNSTDVISCTLISNATCATPMSVSSNGISVTVNSTAAPTLTISSSPGNTICTGTPVTFTANIANGGGSPIFQWKKNGNNVGTNSNTYSDNALVNNDSITCTVVSSAVCAAPNNAVSNSIIMVVNPYVTPTITINANPNDTVCMGTPVTFTASITNGGNSPAFQWTKNNNNTGSNAPSYTDNTLATGDVIACTLTSNTGCTTTPVINAPGISMTVNPLPSVNAGSDQTILQGSSVALTASGASNYLWSNGDTTATTIVSPASTSLYIVSTTNSFGCTARDTAVVTVNFSSLSVAPASYNFGNVVVNMSDVHSITVTNNGTLTETISSANIPAPFSATFSAQTIAPGNSVNIPVTFTPTGTLIYQNTLSIATSAGNFSIILQGRGVNAAPSWSVTPANYSFGNVIVNDSTSHLFAVVNTGNVPINISSISSGNPVFAGSVFNNTIAVGSQVLMSVKFKPLNITSYNGVININAVNVGLSALSLTVNGAGYVPGNPPVLKYPTVAPYNTIVGVDPVIAPAGIFNYHIVYKSPDGRAPMAGYPQVGIDLNADGDFLDAGEGIFAMSELGSGTDWVNGETFTYATNLSIGNTYGYQFFAKDSTGNVATTINTAYKAGPNVTNQVLDLAIYANDITFSNNNPGVGQQFTVSAVVHNNSPYSASNVPVRFYKDSVFLTSTILPFINANSTATITQNFTFSPDGFYPIKVWIDSAATLGENNVLNNYAIRPVIVGNFSLPGTINITSAANTQSCPSPAVLISGYATYAGLNLQGNPPVLGATVTVQIAGGPTLSTNTVTGGYWSVYYNGFSCNTSQTYTVTITDYTLTGTTAAATFVAPCTNCFTDNGGSYYVNSNGSVTGSCIHDGAPFNYTISLLNPCNADTVHNDTTYVYADGILAFTHTTTVLNPCQPATFTDVFTMTTGQHILSYTNVSYDSTGRHTTTQSSAVNVEPSLPELYLGGFSQTGATSFAVNDIDPTCISAGAHKVLVYDSVANSSYVPLDSFSVAAVGGQSFQQLTLNKPSLQMGYHYLRLVTDAHNNVTERDESNDTLNALLYVPFPELTITDLAMSNSNISAGSVINFSANVHNSGSTANAFKVQFLVGGVPVGNKVQVNGLAANGGVSLVVSDPYVVTADSCPKVVTAIVDIDAAIMELIENNNSVAINMASDLTSGVACNGTGSACNPYVIVKNSLTHFNTVVRNIGTRDVSNVNVKFSLSGNGIGSDVIPSIAAQTAATTGLNYSFASAGNYIISVNPDTANTICELDENNNVGAIYINVVEGLPDLEILSQDISPSNLNPNPNQSISVVASVFNTGTLTSRPTTVRFYVDNVQLGADVPIDSIHVGGDTTVMATATYSGATVGPKIIKVVADAANLVAELRENNNEATRAIIVGGAPDLAHSIHEAITFSRSGFRKNEVVDIRNYVRNYGGDSGRAYLKYYITNPLGVKTLLDSVQFTLQSNDSMLISKSWLVNMEGHGVVTTEIAHSNPQEFNELNNIDSLVFTAGPELSIASLNVTDTILCDGEPLSIGYTVHKSAQSVNYEWFKDGSTTGNTSATFFTIPAVTLADSGNYMLRATDSFGVINSPTKHIYVNPVLTPTITIAAYPGNVICDGTSVKFSANTVNGGVGANYQWMKNSTLVGINTPSYIDTGLATSDAIVCTVTSIARCTSHAPVTSNSIAMTVNPLSGALAGANASQTYTVDSGMYLNYTDNGCQLIATVAASMGNDLGPTTATTSINNSLTGFVHRYTEITPTFNLPAMVRLYFLQSEFNAYNVLAAQNGQPLLPVSANDPAVDNIVVYQYHGLPSSGTTGPGGQYDATNSTVIRTTSITKLYNAASGYWEISFPVSGFSGHFLKAEAPTPLSIHLGDIAATNKSSINEVSWNMLHEDAGDYFELERSTNGKDFSKIARIEGKSIASSYLYSDDKAVTGINYYRLRMFESNGRSGLSKVVTATVAHGAFALEVYPNPAKSVLNITTRGAAANGTIRVTDITGNTLKIIPMANQQTIVDISTLSPGIYFVKYSDDEYTQIIRVVKQ